MTGINWGDCGPSRTHSKEYEDNIKKIFKEKEKTQRYVKPMTDEQKKRQAMYPY